jgi:glutaconate CoA-transferase, subunit A
VRTSKFLRSKVVGIEQAVNMVSDGMMLSIGGNHSHDAPSAFVREIVRKGAKDLILVPSNTAGYQVDILIGAGCVSTLYNSYCGLDYLGIAPNFRRLVEYGRLNVVELEEMGLLRGLKATAGGLAFFPLPDGMTAVDVVHTNPDFYKIVKDPFSGRDVVVVPPIKPDLCVVHVPKCDIRGNAIEFGIPDPLHQSADRLILTTEEIVSQEYIEAHHREVTILGQFVDAIVTLPYGAHPGQCAGVYPHDEEHLRLYQRSAQDDIDFKKYLERYVIGKTHAEYLQEIGTDRLLQLKY